MFVTVRKYRNVQGDRNELIETIKNGFVPLISKVDGFIDYYCFFADDGTLTSVNVYRDKHGADESVRIAASFVEQNIAKFLDPWRAEGYAEVEPTDEWILEVVYPVDGFGTEADLDKRHALQDLLNEELGWTGLGHVDGGSTGSGTMEVACFVVDPELAKKVIEDNLRGTEFGDFSEIRAECAE